MREFDTIKMIKRLANSEDYFHTFLDRSNIAAGVINLKPGQADTQEPHDSDEIYYIVSGNGYLKIGRKDYEVSPGRVFFVKADEPHHFFANTETIVAVYFFGGPDS